MYFKYVFQLLVFQLLHNTGTTLEVAANDTVHQLRTIIYTCTRASGCILNKLIHCNSLISQNTLTLSSLDNNLSFNKLLV